MKQVDLISFLCNYYGIVNDNLNFNKLTHFDVKILFPNVKRMNTDELKYNCDKLYTGDVILVYDYKGYILPYFNPRLELENMRILESYIVEKEFIDISKLELDKLSKDELLKLRKKVRRNQQIRDEKIIVKAIRKKKNREVMKYKIKKKMLRMEEF